MHRTSCIYFNNNSCCITNNINILKTIYSCASPEHVKDVNVLNVMSTLSCEPPTNGFVITVSVIIVTGCLLLIGFAIFRVCKNKRRRAYRSSSDVKYVPAERR